MKYQLPDGNTIIASQEFIDEHYPDAVLLPEPAIPTPEPTKPERCTRRQGRLALLAAGKLDDVEGLIASIPGAAERRAAQIEYEADTWERDNAVLQMMWTGLGGTPQELDDLFELAVTL